MEMKYDCGVINLWGRLYHIVTFLVTCHQMMCMDWPLLRVNLQCRNNIISIFFTKVAVQNFNCILIRELSLRIFIRIKCTWIRNVPENCLPWFYVIGNLWLSLLFSLCYLPLCHITLSLIVWSVLTSHCVKGSCVLAFIG